MVGKRSSNMFLVTSITRIIFTFITSILFIAKFNIYEVCAHSLDHSINLRKNLETSCGDLTKARVRCNGGCTVLVNDLSSTYQSCENYCQGHNRKCVGAWDEDDNSCTAKETFGCDFKFTLTPDALCRCSTEIFPKDNSDSTSSYVDLVVAKSSNNNKDSSGEISTFYHDILNKNSDFLNGNSNKNIFFPTAQPKCPRYKVSQTGYKQFSSPKGRPYDEISMIAVSKQTWSGQPVIWIANDKDENFVYASTLHTGKSLCRVELPYNVNNDIESMSIGPCNTDRTTSCLYVANIGNNPAQSCKGGSCNRGAALRSIFKFKEPDIHRHSGKVEASVAILPIDYMDISSPSERADAESFFVDFTGDKNNGKPGDLYIVTKWNKRRRLTRLFKYPVEFHEHAKYGETSEVYSVQPTESSPLKKRTWTDADMSVDGSLIAIRDGRNIYFFTRSSSESVTEALKKKPCEYVYRTPKSKNYAQFEAVGFLPNKNAFAEISECKRSNYGDCDPHAYVIAYK